MSLPVHEWRLEVGRPDHGGRLDSFLQSHLRWRSRARLRAAIEEGAVEILPFKDPQRAEIGKVKPGLRLRVGQEVVVRLAAPQAEEGAGSRTLEPQDLVVVFEDEHLLAVNKPPQLNVYPTRRHRAGSLIELVHERARGGSGDGEPPTPCHRLDRETSGLLLFGKGLTAREGIQRQFEERRVEKAYLAVVVGGPAEDEGRIDGPIEPDTGSSVEIKMRSLPGGGGQPAETAWRVRERLGDRALVELRPRTGRQHQLRVHMAALGCPIVGDKLYLGGDEVFLRSLEGPLAESDLEALGLARQALHAWKLHLRHPVTGEPLTLEAPLWADIAELVGAADAGGAVLGLGASVP